MNIESTSYDVIIIGAGAAGLMCAIESGKRGRRVLVLDHAKKPAEKIRISGGGRCNFTNIYCTPKQFISSNPQFCVSALSRYTPDDFIALVKKHQVSFHEKTLGQLFCDQSSQSIIDLLLSECEENHVTIQLNTQITAIQKETLFSVETTRGTYSCESLVIATGGLSIPKMGATGFGYQIAKQFNIPLVPTRPGLVPFTLDEHKRQMLSPLTGIAIASKVNCNRHSFEEGLLFTHRGISGPAILQISSYWREGQPITINMAPTEIIETFLKSARQDHPKQEIVTILNQLLPKKLALYLKEQNDLPTKIANLNNKQLMNLANKINGWQLTPSGTEGYRTAEVTIGGIDTKALSSKTFECLSVSKLYFIGEVVDVTGWLGGYNFQWAWASGHACGQYT